MSYRVEDWYSPEAKRQVEVMDAVQGQVRIRQSKAHEVFMDPETPPREKDYQKGRLDAFDSVTHTLGEMSARLFLDERKRFRAEGGGTT